MTPRKAPSRAAEWGATVLGLGTVPWAPGTAASIAAVLVLGPLRINRPLLGALVVLLSLAAAWACGAWARSQRVRDPGSAVADEVAGMGLALALAPGTGPLSAAACFVLFRLFDILKPPPVSTAERLPGGIGIVADDLAAGALAAGVVWLARLSPLLDPLTR